MKKEITYYSTDKMYTIPKGSSLFNIKFFIYALLVVSILMVGSGLYFLNSSLKINGKRDIVKYSENGKADYVVYLKDNSYYESKYLSSGMQYVASLINTINADFNYEIHADTNLDYNYKYKIVGTLQIMDKLDPSKVLYNKDYILLDEVEKNTQSNNVVINEDVIIDYNKYNNYVNAYKREYGLTVNSQLILTMSIDVSGKDTKTDKDLVKNNKLQITIPLSEQTLDITIDTAEISNNDHLSINSGLYIKNNLFLIVGLVLTTLGICGLLFDRKSYKKYEKDNIYNITLNKILKDYDRLIVNGTISIKEDKYSNIIYPTSFLELVDASQNLKSPILFYEVQPGEKSFFIIVKDDTLYKFRLTRAYLEREESENKENKNEEEVANLT